MASKVFSVGDAKTITVNNEVITVRIFGFNHDTLSGGGKAKITFGTGYMKNRYDVETRVGYQASNVFGYLNETIYNAMPSDLRSVIKEIKKTSYNGPSPYNSRYLTTYPVKVWLFALIELASATWGSEYDDYYVNDGTRYEYLAGHGTGDYREITRSARGSQGLTGFVNRSTSETGTLLMSGLCDIRFGFCV